MDTPIIEAFSRAIAGPDHGVDLFGAAMTIARLGGHEPDVHRVARELDLMAEAVREHAEGARDPSTLAQAVDHQLFAVLGFRGDQDDYGHPQNSYLDRVVERRMGIPITLSLVYMEVAQRVGLECDGVGYPGHFIVRCGGPEAPIYVDPFHQGARLDRQELLAGLRAHELGGTNPDTFLAAVTRRQILQRMLTNLRISYQERAMLTEWRLAVDLQLCIEPWSLSLYGERGTVHYRLGNVPKALEDLERYVDAGDREQAHVGALRLLDELRGRYRGEEL